MGSIVQLLFSFVENMTTITIKKWVVLKTYTFEDQFEAWWALLHWWIKNNHPKTGDPVLDAYKAGDSIDGEKYLEVLLAQK